MNKRDKGTNWVLIFLVGFSIIAASVSNATTSQPVWNISTVDNAVEVGWGVFMAMDSNDKVHIAYFDLRNRALKYATNITGSWSIYTVESGSVGGGSSIAADLNNKVHIVYYDGINNCVKYATNASGSWVVSTIESSSTYPSVAIDSNNCVHISYLSYTNDILKYATNASGSWVISTIDSSGDSFGPGTSIAIDSNNKVHIIYYINYNNQLHLKYATNDSGWWSTYTIYKHPPITDVLDVFGSLPSLAVDSNGKAHLTYSYHTTPHNLKYATNTSGLWSIYTVDDEGVVASVATDSSNGVHIAYTYLTNFKLKYATNTSGLWVISSIDDQLGMNASIAIDSNDKVHLSYYDAINRELKYATKSSGQPSNQPDITVSPGTTLNFGNVKVGSTSDQTVSVRNDGTANLNIGNITSPLPPFNKTTDNCFGHTLSPAQTCTVTYRFAPTSTGTFASNSNIPSNDPDENSVSVSLSGIGTGSIKPAIENAFPSSGTVGTSVTIVGINFGATKGTSAVKFGSKVANVTSWSDTQIQAVTPSLKPGTYDVILTTQNGNSNALPFTVTIPPPPPPTISSISPVSGTAGTVVTIKGKNFGTTQSSSFVNFGSTQAAINSWSNTQIKAVAPEGLSGEVPVTVTTSFGTSNGRIFAYKSADFRFPLTGDWSPITENFGEWPENQSPPLGYYGYHLAQDIARSASTPVYPMADGTVMFAEFVSGLGYAVHIQHKLSKGDPNGTYVVSVYYHMARLEEEGISLNVGQSVSKNNPIGFVSGNKDDYGTGPHLHFGIRKGKYKQGCDKRTKKWYYSGYTSIYLSKKCPASADDEKDKNKNNPIHQEIMSEWISDPGNFIRSRGGR